VVSRRDPEAGAPRVGQGPPRTRGHRPLRDVHRWHLLGGQKGGSAVGKTKRGKGTKIMAITDALGLPIAIGIASASPHEVTLVEETLDNGFLADAIHRLIGDKAYDSDALDDRLLEERGIELISPNRSNRRIRTQDGRPLRRYTRRWKPQLPPTRHPLRAARRKLSRLRPSRMHRHPVSTFLR